MEETDLSAWNVSTKKKGQLAPTLLLAFDCELACRQDRWNDSPIGTQPPFAAIGKWHE
jgi:hypothetical protein